VYDSAELRIRRIRRIIVLLFGCIVVLLALKLQLRVMGQDMYLPPRLLLFIVLGDSSCICVLLWQVRHIKRGIDSHAPANQGSNIGDLAKILGGYATFEALICGIVFLATKISFRQAAWVYFLFLMPGLLGIPAIARARQLIHRPKASALWFALAMSLFVPAIVVAGEYSGLDRWLGVPMSGGEGIFAALFGTVFVASFAYYSTYKRLSQRELANKVPALREQPPDSA
jgi:hypothetical protein